MRHLERGAFEIIKRINFIVKNKDISESLNQ